jgi:uncharacterized protein (TIGR02145 family)
MKKSIFLIIVLLVAAVVVQTLTSCSEIQDLLDISSSSSDEWQNLSSSSVDTDDNPPSSSSFFSSSSGGANTPSSSSIPAPDAGSFTDSRDSQTYRTVQIGSQIWMAENLNYNAAGGKCYNNVASNCNTYGKLYDWSTAMSFNAGCNENDCASQINTTHKGICPSGWHIPNNEDWNELIDAVGGNDIAGTKLKARSGWKENGNGTDDYGFSAKPGGTGMSIMSMFEYFDLLGDYGYWWSADENGSNAFFWSISYNEAGTDWLDIEKSIMLSVRCLKDGN